MQAAGDTLTQVLILFALLIAGYGLKKLGVIDQTHVRGYTTLILKLTLPAMILYSMASMPFSPTALTESAWILVASIIVYAVLIGLSIPLGRFLDPGQEAGVYRFVLVFSNVGFMGFPIIESVFGKEALFYTAIYNLPFNLLTFTVGVAMLMRKQGRLSELVPWSHLLSPVVISVFVGFGIFLTGFKLPQPLLSSLDLAGSITTPLSMLAVGAMLAGSSMRRALVNWRLWFVSLLRLIVWPLGVFAILRMIAPSFWLAAIPAIISGMPAAANTAILAQEYGASEGLASQAVFLSTLLSVLSIPALAWVLFWWGLAV